MSSQLFSRVLLPLDGSGDWESLIPHLRVFGAAPTSEVIVLEAVSFTETLLEMPNAFSGSDLGIAGDTDIAQKYVAAASGVLRSRGLRARELVQIGTPAATVASVARRQKATLIALAVRERSGFPRSLFHTLPENVLRASPTPVYVVPAVTTEKVVEPPRRSAPIVVPVDGSGLALQSIPAAAEFARRLAGSLVFVHVGKTRADAEPVQRVFGAALRRAESEGIPAEALIRKGEPAAEILKLCEERQAALIAIRTRLSLRDARGPLGSVTVRVLRAAQVPMLIVRKQDRATSPPQPSARTLAVSP